MAKAMPLKLFQVIYRGVQQVVAFKFFHLWSENCQKLSLKDGAFGTLDFIVNKTEQAVQSYAAGRDYLMVSNAKQC